MKPSDEVQNERYEHALELSAFIDSVLSQFYRDPNESDYIRAEILTQWIELLLPLTLDEARIAWRTYQRAGPRTHQGQLKRPDAGWFYRESMKTRKMNAAPAPAAERPPVRKFSKADKDRHLAWLKAEAGNGNLFAKSVSASTQHWVNQHEDSGENT